MMLEMEGTDDDEMGVGVGVTWLTMILICSVSPSPVCSSDRSIGLIGCIFRPATEMAYQLQHNDAPSDFFWNGLVLGRQEQERGAVFIHFDRHSDRRGDGNGNGNGTGTGDFSDHVP